MVCASTYTHPQLWICVSHWYTVVPLSFDLQLRASASRKMRPLLQNLTNLLHSLSPDLVLPRITDPHVLPILLVTYQHKVRTDVRKYCMC